MYVRELGLRDYRNYAQALVHFSPRINLICGENAQGKTNLLEAVYFFATGKSFRAGRGDKELIQFGSSHAALHAIVERGEREYRLEAQLQFGRTKKLTKNGVKLDNNGELSEVLRCVLFSPEDLSLIRDGAAERRRFMNQSLCQLRPKYDKALASYQKLYEHKLRILRDWEEKPSLLDVLDDFSIKMSYYAAIIIHYRARFVARIAPYTNEFSLRCSQGRDKLELRYQTVSAVSNPLGDLNTIAEELIAHAMSHRQAELASRQCLSGTHKDDLIVTINGNDARKYASQGQARTCALSLKLAERELHREELGSYPVLLLDDVLSELDEKRQTVVREQIGQGQVIITSCSDAPIAGLEDGFVFEVKEGNVMQK